MLEVRNLCARFGAVAAVRDVSLTVGAGEHVAVVGPNGAGKTTLLRALMGQHGERSGEIVVDGRPLTKVGATASARAGIAIVPQGRRLFPSLTVHEHLAISCRRTASDRRLERSELLDFFPGLARRLQVRAGMLSGGEQQMLAIGRAILLEPRYVLMDEPTEGLAPSIVANVSSLIAHLPALGMGVLVTDQTHSSLASTGRLLHMERGALRTIQTTQPSGVS